jgi:hypothetical protein
MFDLKSSSPNDHTDYNISGKIYSYNKDDNTDQIPAILKKGCSRGLVNENDLY